MDFTLHSIGTIHTPFTDKADVPVQAVRSTALGQVEVYPEYAGGLDDIQEFSHIILLYVFHRSEGFNLKVKPFLDDEMHGLFATRYPYRPNPLGISVVRLLKRAGNLLEVEGVDVLDGTPLLDIKPYIEDFDVRQNTRAGWYATRSGK